MDFSQNLTGVYGLDRLQYFFKILHYLPGFMALVSLGRRVYKFLLAAHRIHKKCLYGLVHRGSMNRHWVTFQKLVNTLCQLLLFSFEHEATVGLEFPLLVVNVDILVEEWGIEVLILRNIIIFSGKVAPIVEDILDFGLYGIANTVPRLFDILYVIF